MMYNLLMKLVKLAIISKNSENNADVRKTLLDYLENTGNFFIENFANVNDVAPDVDAILVFGGDGTMLKAAKKGAQINAKVLGVNLGNVGFLAELESSVKGNYLESLLLNGNFEEKFMLTANCGGKNFNALNDIVIKSLSTRPIYLDLYVDGNFVDSYHSDGLILSTPTGSTAYSLSAGGPVIAPDVNAIIINPVCPHSLHSRALVVSDKSKIEVIAKGDENAELIVDGDLQIELKNNEKAEIFKAKNKCKFIIDASQKSFYKRLLEKMNRWGTTYR